MKAIQSPWLQRVLADKEAARQLRQALQQKDGSAIILDGRVYQVSLGPTRPGGNKPAA